MDQPGQKDECPFCRTQLNEGASVCPACGARKGVEAEKGVVIRFIIWVHTRFAFLLAWLGLVPLLALSSFQAGERTEFLMAVAALIAGWWLNKWTRWLWIKIFGRLSDPVWYR